MYLKDNEYVQATLAAKEHPYVLEQKFITFLSS